MLENILASKMIPAVHIKYTAKQLGCPASRVFARLNELAGPLQLNMIRPCDPDALDGFELTSQDYEMLSYRLGYQVGWPWISGKFPVTRILKIVVLGAEIVNFDPGDVIHKLRHASDKVEDIYRRIEELAPLGVAPPQVGSESLINFLRKAAERLGGVRLKEMGELNEFLSEIMIRSTMDAWRYLEPSTLIDRPQTGLGVLTAILF